MSDVTVSANIDTFMRAASFAAARNLLFNPDDRVVFDGGSTNSGAITPLLANGIFQELGIIGSITIQPPAAPTTGQLNALTLSLLAIGSQTLDFASGILKPSESTTSWPITMTDGKTYVFKLVYTHGAWCLISIIGGY